MVQQLSSYHLDGLNSSAAVASTSQQLSPRRAQPLSSYRAQPLSSYRLDGHTLFIVVMALFVCDDSFAAAEPATAQHADLAFSLAPSLATHTDSPVIAAIVAATITTALPSQAAAIAFAIAASTIAATSPAVATTTIAAAARSASAVTAAAVAVCATYVGGGDEADDACLSRWYEAAEMQVAQTVAIDHLRPTCFV